MINRYSRAEMANLWSLQARFQHMLQVEIAVAQAQAELGLIPWGAAWGIAKKGKFSISRIEEIEATTKHEVIAFVSSVAESVGENGRYVHFGLTSSDVLDTAFSLQIREAGELLLRSLEHLKGALRQQAREHVSTLCVGRTHGMHAEATTFGFKLAGFLSELIRNEKRLIAALDQVAIVKLSGAVGTYALPTEVEARVGELLFYPLTPEPVATQVIPRDRHAEVIFAIAMIGTGIERLAIELRHLQRTEVGEVTEKFSMGQKGSSAMPHKKNPISAENLTGLARLLRSNLQAAMENIALWHERDISHSSVERVIFPDAFILCDYALHRLADLVSDLGVNKDRMLENLQLSQGDIFSARLLTKLIESGRNREEAYQIVQGLAHSSSGQLRQKVEGLLPQVDLDNIFDLEGQKAHLTAITARALGMD